MITTVPVGVIASSDSTAAIPPPAPITTSSHYWDLTVTGFDMQDTGTNAGDTGTWYFLRNNASRSGVSLREDGTGDVKFLGLNAVPDVRDLYIEPSKQIQSGTNLSTSPIMPCNLSGDFTVEVAFRPTSFSTLWGPSVHMIGSFLLGWDAFGNDGNVRATFQLLNPVGTDEVTPVKPGQWTIQTDWINSQKDYDAFKMGDARGTDEPLINNTYHLLGTFEASTRTMSLYVDGVLAGTDTLTSQEYIDFINSTTGDAQKVLGKLDRYKRDRIYIMADRKASDLPYGSEGYAQDLRIHQGVHMSASQALEQSKVYRLGANLG